jgi:hypothetical protein
MSLGLVRWVRSNIRPPGGSAAENLNPARQPKFSSRGPGRIDYLQPVEAAKRLVGGDDFGDAVFDQRRGDAGVIKRVALRRRDTKKLSENLPVALSLRKPDARWRVERRFQGSPILILGSRGVEHAGMRHNSEEFVDTMLGQHPRRRTRGKLAQSRQRFPVLRSFGAMGIDQNVGVNGPHQRPSMRSNSELRSSRRTPGLMCPPRWGFQSKRYLDFSLGAAITIA